MSVELVLLVLSCLFLLSILVSKAGSRFGVPVLLLFLAVGMFFGTDGMGISFKNFEAAQAIGTFALCIILFSGGLDTKFSDVRPIVAEGVVLATAGVLITAVITGGFIWVATNKLFPSYSLSFMESLLLGSIMSSTDSASVFAVLRSKGTVLKNNLRPLLELESGSNDPMAYMLTITLIQIIMSQSDTSLPMVAFQVVLQLVIGSVLGYSLGKSAVKIMNKINLQNESLYPVLMFTFSILIFSLTYFLKGNGFLAVYIGGLVIGNSNFIMKRTSIKFFDGLAWLSQIAMFLTLGLLVNPLEILPVALLSLTVGVFMILIGRPVSVFLSLFPFKTGFKDKVFLSWVGLRGAVPIVFAIFPFVAGVPQAGVIFNVVFFITLLSLLVQGSSISMIANWLDLSVEPQSGGSFKDFDLEFSEEIKSVLTEITVTEKVILNGATLIDLGLPENSLAVMVKRDDKYLIPRGNTSLEIGDKILIITDDESALKSKYESIGISNYSKKQN